MSSVVSALFQPTGNNMSVEHLIVAHEATEAIHNRSSNDGGFGKYPCVKEKRIKEVASEILRLWMYSVGNLFYARDDKTLAEGLDMFFVEEKKRAGKLICPVRYRSGHNLIFFCFFFCENSPHSRNTMLFRSSQQLPRLFLGPLPPALLPELQRYKDTVRCAALGAEVQGIRQQQLTQTLIVRLLKTHFFTPILDCEKSTV